MERRINKKLENYISDFKDGIKQKITELDFSNNTQEINTLLQYIYDYERISLTKDDFMKRKRVKNVVHLSDRCCARRANGEQCTRRRKDDTSEFCGTHLKGTPHGVCDFKEEIKPQGQKVEIWVQDIQGINYYIDNMFNVYNVEDIMCSKVNPKIIAKYTKVGENYSIPEFNL